MKSGHVTRIEDALRVYSCCNDPSAHANDIKNSSNTNIDKIFQYFDSILGCSIHIVSKTIEKIIQIEQKQIETSVLNQVNTKASKNQTEIRNGLMYNLSTWKSTSREKILYHKITSRIEKELEILGEQCALDNQLLKNKH